MEAVSLRRYRLEKTALAAEQKRVLARQVPATFFIIAAGLIISLFLGLWRGGRSQPTIIIAVFMGLYLCYIAFAMPRKVKKRLAKCWDSYELEIGPDYFLRTQADTPELRLRFDEITRVERLPGRYLRIIGTNKRDVIGIPENIDDFEDVFRSVSAAHAITVRSGELSVRNSVYTAMGATGYLIILWSKSPLLYVPISVALAYACVRLIWKVRSSPNATQQMRRAVLVYLFLLIPCVQRIIQGLQTILKR